MRGDVSTAALSAVDLRFARLDLVADWRRCGIVADFVARYVTYAFERPEAAHLVLSTVCNELIENAVKYSIPGTEEVGLGMRFDGEHVWIETRHDCRPEQVEQLCAFVEQLTATDVEDLFVRQIERTAAEDPAASGLGFITLAKDYGARLEVEVRERGPDLARIAVRAILSVEEVDR